MSPFWLGFIDEKADMLHNWKIQDMVLSNDMNDVPKVRINSKILP